MLYGDKSCLCVGWLPVCEADELGSDIIAIFQDDMINIWNAPAEEYDEYMITSGPLVQAAEFRAPASAIAARLELMGVTGIVAMIMLQSTLLEMDAPRDDAELAGLDDQVREHIRAEEAFIHGLTARKWMTQLATTPGTEDAFHDREVGACGWLLRLLDVNYRWNVLWRLRLILEVFPDSEVSLDVTWMGEEDWYGVDPRALATDAQTTVRGAAARHAPLIVLTEGRNDAEFLSAGLEILYPYLSGLVRLLDYERKPEGGASAVVRMARAFAAAGITNRVVGILDNDTAASDELRGLDCGNLSDNILLIQYPDIDLARNYPTLGPPTAAAPSGSISMADINGLAASVEIYLGRDVLTQVDGNLRPIQWRSFVQGMGRYHGEVVGKKEIHDAFRRKVKSALADPSIVNSQDWDDMRQCWRLYSPLSTTSLLPELHSGGVPSPTAAIDPTPDKIGKRG